MDRVKAWLLRILTGRGEGEDDEGEGLDFLRPLPSRGVLGSGSGGRRAVAAPAARLFAPVINYKAAYNTATEEAV